MDFASSDLGQQVVEDTGYMDLRPVEAPEDLGFLSLIEVKAENISEQDVASLSAMRTATDGAERLSTTFKVAGSGNLDGRGKVDLEQLARMVTSGRLDGQEVVVAGFPGSGEGATLSGNDLSRMIVSRLFELDPLVEEQITVGFRLLGYSGSGAPFCAPGGNGDQGRVEIWVKPLQES